MAYDEKLALKIRKQLAGRSDLAEKKMFGGVGFLVGGNMGVGVLKDELVVRIDPATTDAALKKPGARVFDMSGRPMKGWLMVGGAGVKTPAALAKWVKRGVDYASSLPKKVK